MKALLIGENASHIYDAAGFIDTLKSFGLQVTERISVVISEDKDVKGVLKHYILGNISSYDAFQAIMKIYEDYKPDFLVGVSVKNINEILARLSARVGIPMLTEVTEVVSINDGIKLRRNVLGGRATAIYKVSTPIIVTVPLKKFKTAPHEEVPEVIKCEVKEESPIKRVEVKPKEKGAVDLEAAEVVIGVGRGFKSKEDLALAFDLAKILGGEVGCSRPIAADLQWLGEDRWIGISGKKIRGKLYFAIGISGAPQHIMAASDSKVIVAVNKDENAPIFQYADYGVVADLYKFLPILIKKLKEKLG